MSNEPVTWPLTNTEHGMLVAFGEFWRQHGLLDRLRQVPIGQKTHDFAPQAKLIEFLAGILSGIEHLQDLNHGPRPLALDPVVAQAWGLGGFAHYTTVGRTLRACDDSTVAAVEAAIAAVSRPWIESAVHAQVRRGQRLVYDFDLTGQPVSSTSTTYPAASFGWMNDQVRLGYQLARVCLTTVEGERWWLAGTHHPGATVSAACWQELIRAAEASTGVRPRRRPELVTQRIVQQQASVTRTHQLAEQQQARLERLRATQTEVTGKCYHAEQLQRGPLSPGKQARLEHQLQQWRKRLPRLTTQITRAERVLADHQARLQIQESDRAALQAWQAQLEADNRDNPNPPEVEARADAGFASGENLTWGLEMGYSLNTKAANGHTTPIVRAQLKRGAVWEKVGANAEMILVGDYHLRNCPYPLTVALERFKVGRGFKYATLVRSGPAPRLAEWFAQYNGRQTIEAGNKEMKSTFFVQHLMSRSAAGIQLQVLFTGLAANTVRWCRPWLTDCATAPTPAVTRALNSPKALVRVAANSAALVQSTPAGTTVLFGPRTALPGAAFVLRGTPAVQLPLGFHQPFKIASESANPRPNAHSLR